MAGKAPDKRILAPVRASMSMNQSADTYLLLLPLFQHFVLIYSSDGMAL